MASSSAEKLQELLKLAAIGAQYPDWNASFVPPALYNPDYVPPFNGQGVLPLSVILLVCTLVVVLLRVYARAVRQPSAWGWDDYCILPATLFTMAINFIAIIEYTNLGLGHHAYDLSWYQLSMLYKLIFTHYILYLWAAVFIRMSLAIFYLRLLSRSTGRMALFVKCFMVYLVLLTVAAHFAIIFAYSPISAGYDLNVRLKPFKALNAWVIITCLSSIYAATDIITWVLPLRIIWNVKTTLRRRLGLFVLFSLGGIVCAVVIIRTALLNRLYGTFDVSWAAGSVSLCSEIECNVGIIVASLPAINSMILQAYNSSILSLRSRWNSLFGYSNDKSATPYPVPSDTCNAVPTILAKSKPLMEKQHGWEIDYLKSDAFSSKEESEYEVTNTLPQPLRPRPPARPNTFLLSKTQVTDPASSIPRRPDIESPSLEPRARLPHFDSFLTNHTLTARDLAGSVSCNSSDFSVDLIIQPTHHLPR